MTDSQLVQAAGKSRGVLSIKTGRIHPVLQLMARRHAARQARIRVQGHHEWDQRRQELVVAMPRYRGFSEICAESWSWNNREQAADEMFNSCRQSPGHWSVCNGRCDAWGYSMAKGSNGIWYGVGITAQL